jgi:predicted Zn-dependent protease with MMP-like domain
MGPEDEDLVDAIYDALDRDRPDEALTLARRAAETVPEPDPVLVFLTGIALLELGRGGEAVDELSRAVELDPEDAEFRSRLALALFRSGRFTEASVEVEQALKTDPRLPDAHFVRALLAERRGRLAEADEGFLDASRLDPERFPAPTRIDRAEFEECVGRSMDRLPSRFRQYLGQVAVTVEELPADAILSEGEPPLDPDQLLGLFVGVPLADQAAGGPGALPARILVFKRNLERLALDMDELEEEIAVTVYHELGHYLGLDEDELEGIDLA